MPTAEQMQQAIKPLFPGLMGVEIEEATPERVVASMLVRPDLCTAGGVCHGGAFMAFADTIGAVGTVMHLPPGAEAQRRAPAADPGGPGRVIRDCPACPEMVALPAGEFMMGSPESEKGRNKDEGPQRKVTIARPFAVGKFEVTFAQWDACVTDGGCTHKPGDESWGRGRRPVINVSWDDAKQFVA